MDRIEHHEPPPNNPSEETETAPILLSNEEIVQNRALRKLQEVLTALPLEPSPIEQTPIIEANPELRAIHSAFDDMLEMLRADDDGMHEQEAAA